MKNRTRIIKSVAIITTILLAAFILSCGGGGSSVSNSGVTKVTVNIGESKLASFADKLWGKSSSAIPSNVAAVRIVISGDGTVFFDNTFNVAGSTQIVESFDVPNGLNRDFFAVAMDTNEASLFQGDTKADLDGTPRDITIQMESVTLDVTGAWSLFHTQQTPQVHSEEGPDFFNFIQSGNSVTFSFIDDGGNLKTGNGSVDGNNIQLNFVNTDDCNNPSTIALTGTISQDGNTMTGTYSRPGTSGNCAAGETGTWHVTKALTPAFNISGNWTGFRTPQGGTESDPACFTFTQAGSYLTFSGDIIGSGILSSDNIQLQFAEFFGGGETSTCKVLNHLTGTVASNGSSASGTFTTSNDCGIPPIGGTWRAEKGTLCTQPPPAQGTISGTVTDQLGQLLAGVDVALSQQGLILASGTTDSNGQYNLSAPAGSGYTATFSKSGFITATFDNVTITANATTTLNATLSPVLAAGQTRIVLTWGPDPSDLDSHLTGPILDSAQRFHVYFGAPCFPDGTCTTDNNGNRVPGTDTLAILDHDTTDHSSANPVLSPETTTIVQQISGSYKFYVHAFTCDMPNNIPCELALSNSGASVQVLRGNALVATFNVPTNQTGRVWTVFELNGDVITQINTISPDETVIQSVSHSASSLKKKGTKR